MIKYNSKNIVKWYHGNQPAVKVIRDNIDCFDNTGGGDSPVPPTPTPPSFDGKVRLTYSNGEVYEVPADGNTTLTSTEVYGGSMNKSYIVSAEVGTAVTSIGNQAFTQCRGMTTCTIGSGVTSIDSSAFQSCTSLTSVTIPSGVTSIGDYAFQNCTSLTSVTIPSGVTSIGNCAFGSCSSLTSINISSGVTSIGYYAFSGCSSLTSVTIEAITPPTLQVKLWFDAFSGTNCIIYVPAESVDTYKSASRWSSYANRIQAIPI